MSAWLAVLATYLSIVALTALWTHRDNQRDPGSSGAQHGASPLFVGLRWPLTVAYYAAMMTWHGIAEWRWHRQQSKARAGAPR